MKCQGLRLVVELEKTETEREVSFGTEFAES